MSMLLGLFGVALVSGIIYLILQFVPAGVYDAICGRENCLTILSISYQIIFLTTTLLSSLSDKSETIYWERFTEYVLVNPFLFNFKSLSGIAFLTLATETVAYFVTGDIAAETVACLIIGDIATAVFYGSFILGILIIVFLSARMSSIYFNREHFLKRMLAREKEPDAEKIRTLKDMTIIAAGNQNSRVVKENMELFCKIVGKSSVAEETIDIMIELFDTLLEQGDTAGYLDYISECIVCATADPSKETSLKILMWIIKDPSHLEIWNDCSRKFDLREGINSGGFYKCLREYKKRIISNLPVPIELLSKAFFYAESDEDIKALYAAQKLIDDYEIKMVSVIGFMLECRLAQKIECVLAIALEEVDLVSIYPEENPYSTRERGILLSLLNANENNEAGLSDLILAYQTVVYSMEYETIKYDPKRDDVFTDRLTKLFFGIANPDKDLKDMYHRFMLEFNHSVNARNRYIRWLASECLENEEYTGRLRYVISYDSWIDGSCFDFIGDEDTDEQKAGYAEKYRKSLAFWRDIQKILMKDPKCYEKIRKDIENYMCELGKYYRTLTMK